MGRMRNRKQLTPNHYPSMLFRNKDNTALGMERILQWIFGSVLGKTFFIRMLFLPSTRINTLLTRNYHNVASTSFILSKISIFALVFSAPQFQAQILYVLNSVWLQMKTYLTMIRFYIPLNKEAWVVIPRQSSLFLVVHLCMNLLSRSCSLRHCIYIPGGRRGKGKRLTWSILLNIFSGTPTQ